MNTVPWHFIESVCLRLDHCTLRESRKLSSRWGEACLATSKKMGTLNVTVTNTEGKIYAAVEPIFPERCDTVFSCRLLPLDSVNPKCFTNFLVSSALKDDLSLQSWTEITMDDLQRLIKMARPARGEERSRNLLLLDKFNRTTEKLLSMRLPVDAVNIHITDDGDTSQVDEFIKNAGLLHAVWISGLEQRPLQEAMVSMLLDKFVPIDYSYFCVEQKLTKEQLNILFDKCVVAKKKVQVQLENYGSTINIVDYEKYYAEKTVLEEGRSIMFLNPEEGKLVLRVDRIFENILRWRWCDKEAEADSEEENEGCSDDWEDSDDPPSSSDP
uniref:F-box domain-containing protein n=1 Tax=Steinernema glaseri TaxID=37863 RepID=A0A1I7YTG3_9BILA